MAPRPSIEVLPGPDLPRSIRREVRTLCDRAFEEDLTELFDGMSAEAHVLSRESGILVAHAMWVVRWLQAGSAPPLRTAYVEMVATAPEHQGRGLGKGVMRRLVEELPETVELAALCPATEGFYHGLGWRRWEGPLAIRMPDGTLRPTPEETVMTFALEGREHPDRTSLLTAEWREGELW